MQLCRFTSKGSALLVHFLDSSTLAGSFTQVDGHVGNRHSGAYV